MSPDLAEARARLERIAAGERADSQIDPARATAWWLGDAPARSAVVLLHGFTNNPRQYALLGPQLAARGHAVIAPRIAYHGYRDRMTSADAALRAEDWERGALRALEIAALCGERVVVLGISVAATLAGWLAARVAFDHAIAIAPFCGIRPVPGAANRALGALLRRAPNRFVWWDPRVKEGQAPPHAYPRFPTRALGEGLRLDAELVPAAGGPHARRVTLVTNRCEPAVNNAYARRRFALLAARGIAVDETRIVVPGTHDVIEPEIPQARPDEVYPVLERLIG